MGKEKRPRNKEAIKYLNKKCTDTKLKGSQIVSSQLSNSKRLVIRSDNSCSNECKDDDKMMKDNSMETDFCILRRHCKTRILKINRRKLQRTRSKCTAGKKSALDTSETTKTDNSASGDSRRTSPLIINNVEELNANFTSLVIKNLNKLLRDWIKNYLFNNDDTKKKIQIILDSMIKKLEAKSDYVSSSSTYTIDIRIRESNRKPFNIDLNSITTQSSESKSNTEKGNIQIRKRKALSSFAICNNYKRLISTQSIPRYVHACHQQMIGKTLCYSLSKARRACNKNILLTLSRSNGLLSDSSGLDFLEISSKTLTKHFATFRDKNMVKRNVKKRRIVFIPSSYCKFPGTTSITNINGEIFKRNLQRESETNQPLDTMPSLVKSIFTDDLSNMDSTDGSSSLEKKDINTMTDEMNTRKLEEKSIKLCENSTNMTPHVTVNTAAGNDSISIMFPRVTPSLSLKRLTLSCNDHTSAQNLTECKCRKTRIIKSFSCKACLKTVPKNECDPPLLTIDFLNKDCNNCCQQEVAVKKSAIIHKINSLKKLFAKKQKKTCDLTSTNQSEIEFEKIRHKRFSYKCKKSNTNIHKNDFLNHFQEVFNYFANYKGKRNINLDICINVYPTIESNKRNETICKRLCSTYDERISEKEIFTNDLMSNNSNTKVDDGNTKVTHYCNCEQKIIPLFDEKLADKKVAGNVNSKVAGKIHKSLQNPNNKITTTADLEIAQEVFQLRTIIKDLAITAEKFVTEHMKNTKLETNVVKSNIKQSVYFNNRVECCQSAPNDTAVKNIHESVKKCKSTQLANNPSCQKLSGIKNKKDGKNKTTLDIQARLMKKSTSYNIIDSETILKVTDMTSATQTCTFNSVTDEGLTCSLPKCKSLYDISVDSNKNKLMAFYCEELLRKPDTENLSSSPPPTVSTQGPEGPLGKKKSSANIVTTNERSKLLKNEMDCLECLAVGNNKCANNNFSCSSVFINVDDRVNERKIKIRARRGIGFREGSLCCLLLWIPVLVILWLLYIYIIKDKFKPKTFSLDKLSRSLDYGKNGSHLSITLSDLGF